MSTITKEDISKISRLSRIEVKEEEYEEITEKLNNIINWVNQLNEVDTSNVEPMNNIHAINLRLDEDKVADGEIADEILKNSKHAKYGYFTVPKVIE